MKKILLALVIAGLAIALVSCKKSREAALDGITVRLLTDATGIDDKSFNAAAWRGILEFYGDDWETQKQRGTMYEVVTAQTQDMYIPNLKLVTDEGCDLIAATGFTFADAIGVVAASNPAQKYMIVDVDWINLPNVLEVVFSEHEGSFLVGAAAAMKAQAEAVTNPRFGFIGGVPGPVITRFEVGFIQGVLSVIPDAQFVDYYAADWGRPDLAKTQAKNWYDSGVYAIYSAAGGTGNGTIAQAKEYRAADRNVWAIGVDSDQHEEGLLPSGESAVLTSMLKKVEAGLIFGLKAVKDNTFQGKVIVLDMKAGGVGYSTTNPALTQDIRNRLESARQKIISGEIKVAGTYAEAKTLEGFPQDLRAID
ncbi:MAG: BMP family protein [Treponema sp.]|nr:BMP family protein [Treponema sp.]